MIASTPARVASITAKTDAIVARYAPNVVRWMAGLLWLSNVSWKVPTAFGRSDRGCGGLCGYVNDGIEHPVFPGSGALFENLVEPNLAAFGWLTLFIEGSLAAMLLAGVFVRFAGALGIAQSLGIMASVANTDGEWYWSYLLMAGLHVAVLFIAANSRPLSLRAISIGVATYGAFVSLTHIGEGLTGTSFTFFDDGDKFPGDFWKNVFPGSVALGIVFVALGIVLYVARAAVASRANFVGAGCVAIASVLLFSYDSDGLGIGLGSRASTAAVVAAAGLALLALAPTTLDVRRQAN